MANTLTSGVKSYGSAAKKHEVINFFAPFILVFVAVVFVVVMYVKLRVNINGRKHKLRNLEKLELKLMLDNRKFTTEFAALGSFERLEHVGTRQLGLVKPQRTILLTVAPDKKP